jgi:anti-sigma factor RsiW
MKMNLEMIEILIGKYLDGEITPSEQQILETELNRNPEAEELLRQFQDLHERCSEVLTSELLSQGKTPKEIITLAYQRQSKNPFHKMMNPLGIKYRGTIRFAAGVAAGLIIGLSAHFVLPAATIQTGPVPPNEFVRETARPENPVQEMTRQRLSDQTGDVVRNVDWYNFTDKQGNQWLIEGLRENNAQPAVYDGRI